MHPKPRRPRAPNRTSTKSTASWRERALNAEALANTLRAAVKELDARISDLTGQLYDPDGNHLADITPNSASWCSR